MAGNYSGYFLKGLAGGLQTGVNLGTQIQEMQWQKAQRKKLEEKEAKIEESMSTIGNLFKQYGADSTYSDDEIMQLNTALSAAVPEVQAVWKDAVNAIQTMNKNKFEEDLQWFDLFISQAEGLNPGDVQGIFDMAKSRFQTDKAKNYFTAYEEIQKKKYKPAPETFTSPSGVTEKYPEAGYEYSATAKGYVPIYQKPTAPEKPTDTQVKLAEIDKLTFLTEERRNQMKVNTLANDSATAEKVNAIRAAGGTDADILESLGAGVQGVNPPKPSTPLVVRMVDPNDVLFGTNGIMKDYINSGSQLGEEQKAEIRNNYNVIKPALSEETRKQVEDYLGQIGIDVTTPITEPISESTPEPQPNILQKGISKVKDWLGMEGIPKTGETPTPKVPTEIKEALIPTMTNDELYNALKGLDPSDPIYKALYDEAVKRGLIEK